MNSKAKSVNDILIHGNLEIAEKNKKGQIIVELATLPGASTDPRTRQFWPQTWTAAGC